MVPYPPCVCLHRALQQLLSGMTVDESFRYGARLSLWDFPLLLMKMKALHVTSSLDIHSALMVCFQKYCREELINYLS